MRSSMLSACMGLAISSNPSKGIQLDGFNTWACLVVLRCVGLLGLRRPWRREESGQDGGIQHQSA